MRFADWKYRWHSIATIQGRSIQSTLFNLGIYIVLAVGLAGSAFVVQGNLQYTERNLVYISSEPLLLPALVIMWVTALYLAIGAAVAAARERDRGTLEVLMYGPVDEASFLLGIFISQLELFLGAVIITAVWTNLVTWWLHLAFSFRLVEVLLTSAGMGAAIIAFGLLTAVWGGRTRNAIVYFLLIVILLAAIQVGYQVVSSLALASTATQNDPLLTARNVLAAANSVVRWVSPYSQLDSAVSAILSSDSGAYWQSLGLLLVQVAVLLTGSVYLLKRKGVRG